MWLNVVAEIRLDSQEPIPATWEACFRRALSRAGFTVVWTDVGITAHLRIEGKAETKHLTERDVRQEIEGYAKECALLLAEISVKATPGV